MLSFYSANTKVTNTARAVDECIEIMFGGHIPHGLGTVIVNAPLGHKLDKVASALKESLGDITVLGSSCSGVIGREGVGESMNDISMMAISGLAEDYATAAIERISGSNSYEKGLKLAHALRQKNNDIHTIYLLCPGIDIANDMVLEAFSEVFGKDITIFGGTSSDNMRGLVNHQYINSHVTEHGAWALGIADKSIHSITASSHGYTAYGKPLVVTKSEQNRILELDGKPAWQEYTSRLSITPSPDTLRGETIPIGALAEKLTDNLAAEYRNSHILRIVTKHDSDGTIYYPTSIAEGTKLWLAKRDESLIFSGQAETISCIKDAMKDKKAVAVFQTDCHTRGRLLYGKVLKDEITAMIHSAFDVDGETPPWLGMYGFGEYAKLGAHNAYHNYSGSLMVLYR